MCTPGNEMELATGFLFTEGIISNKEDVVAAAQSVGHTGLKEGEGIVIVELRPGINFSPQKLERHFYTSSSCGVCGKSSISAVKNVMQLQPSGEIHCTPAVILTLPETLKKQQEVFAHTGGLHASALYKLNGELIMTREDVGRHNALDKLIGAALAEGLVPLNEHILLLSGRASFELIQKAAMAGIKIVCAVGAPSSLAVELAKENDITLVGFLRDKRFNVYSGGRRVVDN
jgi:FdhD protein